MMEIKLDAVAQNISHCSNNHKKENGQNKESGELRATEKKQSKGGAILLQQTMSALRGMGRFCSLQGSAGNLGQKRRINKD